MPESVSLTVRNLTKTFDTKRRDEARVRAVDDITLEIQPGELFTMLGPSGCGKTTTLRSIAGLETPDSGEIRVGDNTLFSSEDRIRVPSAKRGLGMVFQSYAVWPHMNVFNNVAFPLRVLPRDRRPSRSTIGERVERVLDVVKLGDLGQRPATDLSGGQQQRLALARALIMEPPILLLDEPLSNLDALLREEMVFELKRLQRELRITSIYVTHDQTEALAMSSRIAVMNLGKIMQVGKPREIYSNPASKFVAEFIGTTNYMSGKVARDLGQGSYSVDTVCGPLVVFPKSDLVVGKDVELSIRPEDIRLTELDAGEIPQSGEWAGNVLALTFLGDAVEHLISVGPLELKVRTPGHVSVRSGELVALDVDGSKVAVLH